MQALVASLFLPLLGAVLCRLGAGILRSGGAARVAVAAVGLSHGFAWLAFGWMMATDGPALSRDIALFPLLTAGDLEVDFLLRWDSLSQLMLLVVTGVGFLIHLYSAAYMERDRRAALFFADLNLFVFSMLLLVLAGNFLLLFAGWELVGLCSYLLIGFWHARPSAAAAGVKAFVVNRVGDAGFLLALLMIAGSLGSLDFTRVFATAPGVFLPGSGAALLLVLLLFCGAVGKSAQFPLHVWLPDAMEGPTPVSALIHAATMVTAGVYLVCRCHGLFELSPPALVFVAWTGAFTALFAATLALAQRDLKRILAFSTVSQLGLMFLGAGVGAYGAAVFHLFTHALFKAALFLCAGAVMHGLAGQLDVWRMGGLARPLRWTFLSFTAAGLALAGAPLTAGFFSKDLILHSAFMSQPGGGCLWGMGLATGVLTAVYIFRALWLVFLGPPRSPEACAAHEAPALMRWPTAVLAGFSLVAGALWLPGSWGLVSPFREFLSASLGGDTGGMPSVHGEGSLMAAASAAFLAGLGAAWWFYRRGARALKALGGKLRAPYRVLVSRYYIDELYAGLVRKLYAFAGRAEEGFDRGVVDRAAHGAANAALAASGRGRGLQTGNFGHYALAFAGGAAALALAALAAALAVFL